MPGHLISTCANTECSALFSLLNALMMAILLRQGASAQQRLTQVDKIIEQFGIFQPVENTGEHPSEVP